MCNSTCIIYFKISTSGSFTFSWPKLFPDRADYGVSSFVLRPLPVFLALPGRTLLQMSCTLFTQTEETDGLEENATGPRKWILRLWYNVNDTMFILPWPSVLNVVYWYLVWLFLTIRHIILPHPTSIAVRWCMDFSAFLIYAYLELYVISWNMVLRYQRILNQASFIQY